ncbi:hypothetical protein EUGRSUZ_E01419 [Eucalyptus grandis]|uniref:Uncharacterized protein n=2 Tax=Eucalyptus grandis TaxID=71139 RepID=A0ACC3KU70_EUCGR|nr:hypothetical protein EUGRSUZ_E01419 [Eucalyptus grandis]
MHWNIKTTYLCNTQLHANILGGAELCPLCQPHSNQIVLVFHDPMTKRLVQEAPKWVNSPLADRTHSEVSCEGDHIKKYHPHPASKKLFSIQSTAILFLSP